MFLWSGTRTKSGAIYLRIQDVVADHERARGFVEQATQRCGGNRTVIVPRRAAARFFKRTQEFKNGAIACRVLPEATVKGNTVCEIGRRKRPKAMTNSRLFAEVAPRAKAPCDRNGHTEHPLRRQPSLPAPQDLRRLREPVKHHAGKDQIEPLRQITRTSISAKDRKARYFSLCLAQHRRCDIKSRELCRRPACRRCGEHEACAAANIKNASRCRESCTSHQRFRHLGLHPGGGVIAGSSLVKGARDR